MDFLVRLKEEYKDYGIKNESKDGFDSLEIINPFWQENIRLSLEGDDITFYFAFQHAHFEGDIEGLIEYINDYIHERQVSIEFFVDDKDLFGGGIYQADIDTSSGESLLKCFAGDNRQLYEDLHKRLQGHDCRCSIRGWNVEHNLDIEFVL